MATAVLTGANLPQFITATRQQYLERGTAIAADLHNLRSKRNTWRAQIQASPLGDALDLMQHLENAFSLIASPQYH
jgi:predicted O-linked N-acetylglucosamine transferase (SPINDLY family)